MGILSFFKSTLPPLELQNVGPKITPIYDASLDIEANSSFGGYGYAPAVYSEFTGEKFHGGFGVTELLTMDYWTLRQRSGQLFHQNLYARGIIRRMVTNEINTGLTLECLPEESILGLPEESLAGWSDDIEKRFGIWGLNRAGFENDSSFGQLQRVIRRESLIEGDILVVLNHDKKTGVPRIQLVSGQRVRTPLGKFGENIVDGVELNEYGGHIAYHVLKKDNTFVRIEAYGRTTGRRMAWLVYSTDKRYCEVRGEPILSIILQSLKEIDRYRDAALRKSVINSILAMFISKENDKMGTTPMTGAATLKRPVTATSGGETRSFNLSDYAAPGIILDELQQGEIPHAFKTETDVNFGGFEETIVQAMAWALEIPPEILRLTFSSNYSASQASINEYKMYLNPTREYFAEQVNQPIYTEWLINEVLTNRVKAAGFLDAYRQGDFYTTGAWLMTDWSGAIKPSVDMVKMAKAAEIMVDRGWISNDRVARELTGTKFSRNVKRNKIDNEMLVEMRRPLAEFNSEYAIKPVPAADIEDENIEKPD